MPTGDAQHETDDRFPSGEWTGFFVQPDSRQRHGMDLALRFAQGKISGEGSDAVGDFTIEGSYDIAKAKCLWRKHYIGQHSVEYAGEAREGGIVGQWRIQGQPMFWSGPFFVWPRALGDLHSAFERAFLHYELSTLFDVPQATDPVEASTLGE